MSTEADAAEVAPATRALSPAAVARRGQLVWRRSDRFTVALWAIVVAQAAWLATLISRGWYYQADFSNLVDGSGRLSLSYLTQSQGGHLAIGDRFLYWVMYRTMPLDHGAVVALEVAVQAVTTVLLARLLVLLVGRRPAVLVVTALYAVSPFGIQTLQWFTASVAFLPSQVFVLLALHAHVRYAFDRRLRWAAGAALCLFAAAAFSEQSAVIALGLPLLSVGFLTDGPLRRRIGFVLRCWPEWTFIAAPIVAFLAYFFGSGRFVERGQTGVGAGTALRVTAVEFRESVLPTMFGGPLHWQGSPGNYLLLVQPAVWLQVAAGGLVTLLFIAGVRRTGWRAVVAWSIPVVVAVVGIVVVAVGRYRGFGMIIARQLEHSGYFAIPLAVAVCLSLWAGPASAIAERVARGGTGDPGTRGIETAGRGRPKRVAAAVAVLTILALSVTSQTTYTRGWAKSPARDYVRTLSRELDRLGPGVAMYDTPVNQTVIPLISPHHHLSDLVRLMGRSVRFNVPGRLLVVRSDGSIGPSALLIAARGRQPESKGCAIIVRGAGDWEIPLTTVPHESEYVLRMSYLQPAASVVDFAVRASDGTRIAPVAGERTELPDTLSTVTLRLPLVAPRAVLVHSGSLATNLCLGAVLVAAPVPATR